MTNPTNPAAAARKAELALTITRMFDAPRERVFQAWTDPAQIAHWLGPRSISAKVDKMDLRPGGAYRIVFLGEAGEVHSVGGNYREIVPPERLAFSWTWETEAANHSAGHETMVVLTFKALDGKTEMTMQHERFDTTASYDGHKQGWSGSFDKLAELLAHGPNAP